MIMRRFARSVVLAVSILLTATAAISQQPAGFKIRGNATHLPAELFASGLPNLRLQSSYASNPTFSAAVRLDGTFEFSNIPSGSYSMYFVGQSRRLPIPPIELQSTDIEDMSVDLMNNPFPEMPGGSVAPIIDTSRTRDLDGTVTSEILSPGTPAKAPARYFRMRVGGDSWAVLLYVLDGIVPTPANSRLHVGDHVRILVHPSRDGNRRAMLVQPDKNDPFAGVAIN
jgi:hypothetical protein